MTWNTNTSILARLETYSDDSAWTGLVTHFQKPLTRYVGRAGVPAALVPDVVQETLVAFAAAYRGGDYDRSRGSLSSWLFGIARNQIASARRRAALDPVVAFEASREQGFPDPAGDVFEAIWEEEWRRAVTERCIERVRGEIAPGVWECFALQVFEGLRAEEVADRLGLSRARVYDIKYRVTRRLREIEREHEDV
jgi:RNA polymerase sigma factor (sigma-70 family)